MTVLGLSIAAISIVMLAMAVGVVFKGSYLRGSCGGVLYGPDEEPLNCDTCPYREENPDCERRRSETAQSH